MTVIKKNTINVGEDVEKGELLYIVCGNKIGAATMENSLNGSQKLKIELRVIHQFHSWVYM